MKSPCCDAPLEAVETRDTGADDRAIRRRRRCANCGQRYTTYEVLADNATISVNLKRLGGRLYVGRKGEVNVILDE